MLAEIAAASLQGVAALGRRAGTRVRQCGHDLDSVAVPTLGLCHARWDGFDLHAGLVVRAGERERLELVCRYALRPPVPQDRLSLTSDGQVQLTLRRRWSDGTTHLVFEPIEFLERLAALTPRPRINLILYHGVLAPRAAWRRLVVSQREPPCPGDAHTRQTEAEPGVTSQTNRLCPDGQLWAALMRRSFGFDVLACPRCGGRLQLIALIEQPAVVQRILGHLGLSTEIPVPRPSRAPPLPLDPLVFVDDAAAS